MVALTVLLLHRTPDPAPGGGHHFDWMFQRPGGGPLITFRLASRPTPAGPWPLRAERLADHREAFLTFEGPLTGDRGSVERIDSGNCELTIDTDAELSARIRLGPLAGELVGQAIGNSLWLLDFHPASMTPHS
jgi:hypothetical protein